ncbi:hypothetical protein D3C72_1764500 [compost metagenome]
MLAAMPLCCRTQELAPSAPTISCACSSRPSSRTIAASRALWRSCCGRTPLSSVTPLACCSRCQIVASIQRFSAIHASASAPASAAEKAIWPPWSPRTSMLPITPRREASGHAPSCCKKARLAGLTA